MRAVPLGIGHVAVLTVDLDRFRRFYEDVVGLRTFMVSAPPGAPFHRLGALAVAEHSVVLAFEVPGHDPTGIGTQVEERGRIDHVAFRVADPDALGEVARRLVDAGASSGAVDRHGPILSAHFVDPDGRAGNVSCWDPAYDPATEVLELYDAELFGRLPGREKATSPRP